MSKSVKLSSSLLYIANIIATYDKQVPVPKNVLKIIYDIYKPAMSKYDVSREFKFDDDVYKFLSEKFTDQRWNEKLYSATLSQMFSITEVGKLLSEHVDVHNTVYDFIILSRYDLILNEFPNLNELNKEKFYMQCENKKFLDQILVFGPKFRNFLTIFDKMNWIVRQYGKKFRIPTCEIFKYYYFLSMFDENDFARTNMDNVLIRRYRK